MLILRHLTVEQAYIMYGDELDYQLIGRFLGLYYPHFDWAKMSSLENLCRERNNFVVPIQEFRRWMEW